MRSRNPDTSSAVLIGLTSFTVLICFIGAFLLPESLFAAGWFRRICFGLFVAGFVLTPWLFRLAERSRIREFIAEQGGAVLEMRRLPFWKQDDWLYPRGWFWRGAKYHVRFVDLLGLEHRALFRSSFGGGIQPVEDVIIDRPPSA